MSTLIIVKRNGGDYCRAIHDADLRLRENGHGGIWVIDVASPTAIETVYMPSKEAAIAAFEEIIRAIKADEKVIVFEEKDG